MDFPPGYNWFLILVAVVVALLVFAATLYILVHYQHPDDANQAWFPKIVVVFGLWLAIVTILLFPLDVANRAACDAAISESACVFTLPMTQLWYSVYIAALVLEFLIIPFTVFYYEGDSDYTFGTRIKSALGWTAATLTCLALIVGISYGLVGYVDYPSQQLVSGLVSVDNLANVSTTVSTDCLKPGVALPTYNGTGIADGLCTAFSNTYKSETFTLRVSFVVYIMALQSVFGWILFLIFAGWGTLAAPIDWIFQYIRRPKAVITKSEFINRARGLAQRAKEIKTMADMLKRQERDGGKNRTWRGNFKRLQREVLQLEEDHTALDAVFPQGEDGEVRWVLYQLGFLLLLFMGIIGICLSGAWIAHIIIYMLPPRPINPMLNKVFDDLDGVFPLFGVAAFAGFCLYLMTVAVKGNFLLGLNFVVVKLYPIRAGATFMSSFLVNTALILAMAGAVIQFCATAFAAYASSTQIFDIFGNQVMYLRNLKWVYQLNVFLYMMLSMMILSLIFMVIKGPGQWKRKTAKDAYTY